MVEPIAAASCGAVAFSPVIVAAAPAVAPPAVGVAYVTIRAMVCPAPSQTAQPDGTPIARALLDACAANADANVRRVRETSGTHARPRAVDGGLAPSAGARERDRERR